MALTLEEAILHCKDTAASCNIKACSDDHRQLAEWLSELQSFRKWYKKWYYDTEASAELKCLNLKNIISKANLLFDKDIENILSKYDDATLKQTLLKIKGSLQDLTALLTRILAALQYNK